MLRPKHAGRIAERIAARLIRLAPPVAQAVHTGYPQRQSPFEQARGEIRTILRAAKLLATQKDRKAALSFVLADRSLDHIRHLLGPVLAEKPISALAGDADSLAGEARDFAITVLATECAIKLAPYPDWTRPSPMQIHPSGTSAGPPRLGSRHIDHEAAAFRELHLFMLDPDRRKHDFRYRQDIRSRLEDLIRNHQLDPDCTTARASSPHILSCTKKRQLPSSRGQAPCGG